MIQLADGTPEPRRFIEYIIQNDFYLRGYSQALAPSIARAPHVGTRSFWAWSARGAVAAKTPMHGALPNDPLLRSTPRATAPSPTTCSYVNFIQIAVAYDPYPVGVTVVLSCYWVYIQMGLGLAERAGAVENYPYGTQVAAYADPAFQETTAVAIELLDEAAETADDATRAVMLGIFADATRYEELFRECSYCLEVWTL